MGFMQQILDLNNTYLDMTLHNTTTQYSKYPYKMHFMST